MSAGVNMAATLQVFPSPFIIMHELGKALHVPVTLVAPVQSHYHLKVTINPITPELSLIIAGRTYIDLPITIDITQCEPSRALRADRNTAHLPAHAKV